MTRIGPALIALASILVLARSAAGQPEVEDVHASPAPMPAEPALPAPVQPAPAPSYAPPPSAATPSYALPGSAPAPLVVFDDSRWVIRSAAFDERLYLREALSRDPEFLAGRRRQIWGAVLAGLGGGAVAIGGLTALVTYGPDVGCSGRHDYPGCDDPEKAVIIGTLVAGGVAMAVGIPLAISGARQTKRARARVGADLRLRAGIAPTGQGASAVASVEF